MNDPADSLVLQWQQYLRDTLDVDHSDDWSVEVLATCGSTQDEAFQRYRGRNLVVVTLEQTGGRGRLGRKWSHASSQNRPLGLACTFALPADGQLLDRLSVRAGLVAREVCEQSLQMQWHEEPAFGVKWPNDVVVRSTLPGSGGPFKKIGGVLVERKASSHGDVVFVGLGINVEQRFQDFPDEVRDRATSIVEVAIEKGMYEPESQNVLSVAGVLCQEFAHALRFQHRDSDESKLLESWNSADVLVGTTQEFVSDGKRVSGIVEAIDPWRHIDLRTIAGRVRLSAPSASLFQN